MVEFRVGDTVTLCASIIDFCGQYSLYRLYDINIAKGTCSINAGVPNGCLNLSGVNIEFQWTNTRNSAVAHSCGVTNKLKSLGTATTNSQGIASINYNLTQEDLNLYDANTEFEMRACMKDVSNVVYSGEVRNAFRPADHIVISPSTPVVQPTHYVVLPVSLIPPEAADLISNNISDISKELIKRTGSPPAPWAYIKTTYDKNTNSFILWFNNPVVPVATYVKYDIASDILSLADWVWTILSIIIAVAIAVIAVIAIAIPGSITITVAGIIALFAGAVIVGLRIYTLFTQNKELQKEVDNLKVKVAQEQLPSKIKEIVIECWNNSNKSQDACLKCRLELYRDSHIEYIKGYQIKYPKYPSLASELSTEIDTFKSKTNTIIDNFKQQTYSEIVCNTSYILMDTEVSLSQMRTKAIVDKYITGGAYSVKCSDYTSSDMCTRAGCMWYFGSCIDRADCLLVEPINKTCLLKTGDIIVGAGIALGAIGTIIYAPMLLSKVISIGEYIKEEKKEK